MFIYAVKKCTQSFKQMCNKNLYIIKLFTTEFRNMNGNDAETRTGGLGYINILIHLFLSWPFLYQSLNGEELYIKI